MTPVFSVLSSILYTFIFHVVAVSMPYKYLYNNNNNNNNNNINNNCTNNKYADVGVGVEDDP